MIRIFSFVFRVHRHVFFDLLNFGALWVDGATSESEVKDVWKALVNSPKFVWCNHPDRMEAVRVTRQSTEAGTDWCVEFPAFDCDFATNGYF